MAEVGPLSVADALARILDGVEPTGTETAPLIEAHGRALAADVAATLTQPPFDGSAMDGYAVQAADVAVLPASLSVIGEAAAGHSFPGLVGPGEAVRIFTGAPVPQGADAIVIQENTSRDGDTVTVRGGVPDPQHVRKQGQDFALGDVLLRTGDILKPRTLTLAAAMGHGVLPVRRKPVIAILATGDELVMPGTPPGPDQIVCSNPFGLAAMVHAAGGEPRFLGIARDKRTALAEKVVAAEGADVLVTIGGASEGDHDLVAPVLKERGLKLEFWKIAMRPGKPLIFGKLGQTRVLGLPGNPVSTLICGRVFLVPLVRRLLGIPSLHDEAETAILTHALGPNGPRAHYMRGRREAGAAGPRVTALSQQDSSLLSPLAFADCIIVQPAHSPGLPEGAQVSVLELGF